MFVHEERYTEIEKCRAWMYTEQDWTQCAKKAENAAKHHNRRSRRIMARGRLESQEVLRLYNAARWKCVYCGRQCYCVENQPNDMTLDHVRPLASGGTNDIGNIVPACRHCNNHKSGKSLVQWLEEIGMPAGEFFRRWSRLRLRVFIFEFVMQEPDLHK